MRMSYDGLIFKAMLAELKAIRQLIEEIKAADRAVEAPAKAGGDTKPGGTGL